VGPLFAKGVPSEERRAKRERVLDKERDRRGERREKREIEGEGERKERVRDS
jgi:hypothetical protein